MVTGYLITELHDEFQFFCSIFHDDWIIILPLILIFETTSLNSLESETSEILVEESPAEPSDEVHAEGSQEHHKVRGQLLGVDVGNPHDTQGPDTQGDKSRGEAKAF